MNLSGLNARGSTLASERTQQSLVPVAGRRDELADDPAERMALVAVAVTGRHGRDELEPVRPGGVRQAALVL